MGNFSYISKNANEPVKNPWNEKTLCEIQFVLDGNVVEKLRGIYSGYGSVDTKKEFSHHVLTDGQWKDVTKATKKRAKNFSSDGEIWLTHPWDYIGGIHYGMSDDGIAIWHLDSFDQTIPLATSKCDNDPDQGDAKFHDDDRMSDNNWY